MPGAIPHITAGISLFIISVYYYKNYINENKKFIKLFLLAFACISLSIIPDSILILYYSTKEFSWSSFQDTLPYHNLLHLILFIIAFFSFFIIKFFFNIKNKPIFIVGIAAIILHITIDIFLPGFNLLI